MNNFSFWTTSNIVSATVFSEVELSRKTFKKYYMKISQSFEKCKPTYPKVWLMLRIKKF